eukprot:scaffold1841_cov35-Tisochrysis_lutea.AAC.5
MIHGRESRGGAYCAASDQTSAMAVRCTWYGMSKKTRTMDGVIARTACGPATAKLTSCGTGGGGKGGGGSVVQRQHPVLSSSS